MTNTERNKIPTPFSREANVESTIDYMGSLMTFLAKGSETSGRFALMLYHTKPGKEPPLHVHDREHEFYFVLEGTMRFYCEEKILDIGAGDVVFLPQGKPHAFISTSNLVRTLIFVQAAGNDPGPALEGRRTRRVHDRCSAGQQARSQGRGLGAGLRARWGIARHRQGRAFAGRDRRRHTR